MQPPPSPQQVVTCSSKVGERQVCPADTLAGVALLRSTGTATCLLGKTWGYDDKGVWVFDGCGGEFGLGSTHEASGGNNFLGTFEPYGQWRTHLATFDDTAEVQDNATRVGINFRTRGDIQMFVGTEWGVNFVQSSTQFNLSAAGPGEFGQVTTATSTPFITRLGFVGIDFGPAGRVAIGKQWSAHYDVTSYTTDRFNVFGGQGTSTYVAGSDGGVTGTGRADRVVTYRNKIAKIFDVGLQAQFRGTEKNGVGGSAQVTVMPGVKVGAAFTHTNFPQATRDGVQGLDENADYAALGTRIDWKYLEVGFVYTHQTSGDMVQVPVGNATRNVAFNADGTELYVRARGGADRRDWRLHPAEPEGQGSAAQSGVQDQLRDPGWRVAGHAARQALLGEQARSRHRVGDGRGGRQRVHHRLPLRLLVEDQPQVDDLTLGCWP